MLFIFYPLFFRTTCSHGPVLPSRVWGRKDDGVHDVLEFVSGASTRRSLSCRSERRPGPGGTDVNETRVRRRDGFQATRYSSSTMSRALSRQRGPAREVPAWRRPEQAAPCCRPSTRRQRPGDPLVDEPGRRDDGARPPRRRPSARSFPLTLCPTPSWRSRRSSRSCMRSSLTVAAAAPFATMALSSMGRSASCSENGPCRGGGPCASLGAAAVGVDAGVRYAIGIFRGDKISPRVDPSRSSRRLWKRSPSCCCLISRAPVGY